MRSLARSVPKPLKGPSLARSVTKPLKVVDFFLTFVRFSLRCGVLPYVAGVFQPSGVPGESQLVLTGTGHFGPV